MQIGQMERIRLGDFPTPLEELDRLREHLGGPRLFIKRDDLSGLGLGGNKLRKLEYAMAEAVADRATVVVTVGGPQSNHVRLTAAAANRLGLRSILVLRGDEPPESSGNLLIDRILGVEEIHFVGSSGFPPKGARDELADPKVDEIVARLRGSGERPYVIPNGCRPLHAAYAYADCVLELIAQGAALGVAVDSVVTAVGTSGTQTGLVLGSHLYAGGEIDVVGISVANGTKPLTDRIARQLDEAVGVLGRRTPIPRDAIHVLDEYVGDGYGRPTVGMVEAVLLTARTEGILLDPVYTGKAMAGLIDRIRAGHYTEDDVVVFLHTGGVPGLFAADQTSAFHDA